MVDSLLKSKGLRLTAPRQKVLEYFQETSVPVSFTTLCEHFKDHSIDDATIYRNLLKFVEVDLVHVIQQPGDVSLYQLSNHDHEHHVHPHFSCTSCKTVQCLPELTVKFKEKSPWDKSLEDAVLHFSGVCPDCA